MIGHRMKKTTFLLLVITAALASAEDILITWEAPITCPEVRQGPLGEYFMIPGAVNSGVPGEPALPVFPVRVLLPQGAVVDEVIPLSQLSSELPGTVDLKPIQHGVPISMPYLFTPTPRDVQAYSRIAEPPLVEAVSQGYLMGCNILDLKISPIVWDPATGKATLTTLAAFRVSYHYELDAPVPMSRGQEGNRLLQSIVRSQVINPEGFIPYPVTESRDLPWGEYLIITRDSLVDVFEPLAQFKTMKGIPARIVTMEYIESNYGGIDAAQKLRFFLRDIYETTPPTWILLGGDTPLVPHRNCWATAESYVDNPAADIYYQDMNDPQVGTDYWDYNGNGIWGETSGDIMDYHPDYFIGRAAVENAPEANIFVNKVLAYELPQLSDGRDTDPWYTSMGFTTGILWSSPYCPGSAGKEKVDTLYTPPQWQPVIKHYESAGTQSYSLTMAMLNAGMNLVNHACHGSNNSVSIGSGSLGSGDFMGLTNISEHGRVSIWNTLACLSGSFDTGDCLAEAWITSPGGGGFCMMNTRYGWGEPSEPGGQWSDLVDQEFFKNFFTEDLFNLGVAHSMAWDEFIPLIPSDPHYDWIAKSITLFGDPELPMWLNAPDGPLQVNGPDSLYVGVNNITVSVTDNSGPVNDARVCIMQGEWDDPCMYEVDYTGGSGQVNMTVTATDDHDTAALTVWGRDHAAVTIDIPVTLNGVSGPETPVLNPSVSRPFPNPAVGSVAFQWASPNGEASILIIDAAGRMIRRMELEPGGSGSLLWKCDDENGSPVPSGLYFALFQAEGSAPVTRSLVVVNND
jgi:hypothetical protein